MENGKSFSSAVPDGGVTFLSPNKKGRPPAGVGEHLAYGNENILAHSIEALRERLKEEGLGDRPLIVEEWSSTVWQRDLCNDTCYKSAYLFKNILKNNSRAGALGYFALNDRLEEIPPPPTPSTAASACSPRTGFPKAPIMPWFCWQSWETGSFPRGRGIWFPSGSGKPDCNRIFSTRRNFL